MSAEAKELNAIKRLLILLLIKNKASQEEIARVLGVEQPTVSRMINPKNKPLSEGKETAEESQNS